MPPFGASSFLHGLVWRVIGSLAAHCRASELFDWLRGLPENHELAHLCDVYTYTTIISQCGSHQQLRKALELVAEMRGHGVMCNVHTYSALMNVCIKVTFPAPATLACVVLLCHVPSVHGKRIILSPRLLQAVKGVE